MYAAMYGGGESGNAPVGASGKMPVQREDRRQTRGVVIFHFESFGGRRIAENHSQTATERTAEWFSGIFRRPTVEQEKSALTEGAPHENAQTEGRIGAQGCPRAQGCIDA